MSTPIHRGSRHTYEQYLRFEADASDRHEFLSGEIYAMAGGTPEHAKLSSRALTQLARQLPKGCEAYNPDLRIRIDALDIATYPDAQVICGAVVPSIQDANAATNPVVVLEVTSPSSERYDRGDKLRAYWMLRSVQEVVIVSHQGQHVIVHRRDGTSVEATTGQLQLKSVPVSLDVDALYAP